jgi:hypothetical protein
MGVVSVRLDPSDEAWIRRHGHKPGSFARQAVHDAIRRTEIEAANGRLAALRLDSGVDAVAFFRKDRRSH